MLGFRLQTAYLSVTYLDRFLSRRFIDVSIRFSVYKNIIEKVLIWTKMIFFFFLSIELQSDKLWAIRLLSVACVSLAAKMEEVKVPGLSQLQNIDGYNFGNSVTLRMELMVLTTMDWKMGSITPFAFLHHFIRKFCKDSSPSNILSRTVALILSIMRGIRPFLKYIPSISNQLSLIGMLIWFRNQFDGVSTVCNSSSCHLGSVWSKANKTSIGVLLWISWNCESFIFS